MTRGAIGAGTLMVALLVAGPTVSAQSRESHWGVSASLVPRWMFPETLADIWNMETDMGGTEMRVGVVRGSDFGGDVGISFVKKRVDDESTVFVREPACVDVPGNRAACARGAYHITEDAGMTGVEAHVYIPFARVRNRVQIGATFAGGVARFDGTTDRFLEHLVVNGQDVTVGTDPMGTGPFKEALQDLPQDWEVLPIGRVDLGVGFLMRPGLKLRVTAGVNFPGYNVLGLHLHYLFGAN